MRTFVGRFILSIAIGTVASLSAVYADVPVWFHEQENLKQHISTGFDFAYIDKSGKIVISGPFGHASDFAGGIALVDVKSLDLVNGEWKIPDAFNHDIQAIAVDGTLQDKYHQPPVHTFIDDFTLIPLPRAHDANYALVDKNWQEVSRIKAGQLGVYSNGLIANHDDKTKSWGYIDKDGKQVIVPQFTEANRFSEDFACVREKRTPEKISFIDKTGKTVFKPVFSNAHEFHVGICAVQKDKKWGFIDKAGATIIPFEYDWADNFSQTKTGKIAAVAKDGKIGFIDSNNSIILPFDFADAMSFSEGLAPATKDGKVWGFIDTNGKFVIEPQFLRASKFNSGRALVYTNARNDFGKRKEDAQYLFLTGKNALTNKEVDKAIAAFNAAIKLAPGTPPAKKSRYYLESATPQKPVSTDVVSMLREVEMTEATGRHKEAQAILDKCFSQAPHSEWVAMKVSHSKINEGKTEEARKILDKMVEVNNKYAPTYIHLARVAFANGDEREAKRLIEKAHELNPYSELVNEYYPFSPAKMKVTTTPL
ncbi:MAG: WG repeat-containing protein [Cyanobacteria bacterium TGS_CYA1]|nr:WG repeat-containing protein [Cyanobacteria bacterium TGS_CYA1]